MNVPVQGPRDRNRPEKGKDAMKSGDGNGSGRRQSKSFKSLLAVLTFLAGLAAAAAPVAGAGDTYVIGGAPGVGEVRTDVVRSGSRSTAVPLVVLDPRFVESQQERYEKAAAAAGPLAEGKGAAVPAAVSDACGEAKNRLAGGAGTAGGEGIVSLAGKIRNSLRAGRGSSARERSTALLGILKGAVPLEKTR